MSSPQQVGLEFTGSSTGAVGAARATAAGIAGVRREANTLSPSLRTVERDVGRASRGMLAGSGVFRGFGRSVAFASGSFLGGAGLLELMRKSVDQAETLTKAHASLETSITRLGGDWRRARPELDAWAESQAKYGVSVTESLQGLARLIPLTGSVAKAQLAYSLALKLSKGDNIDLSVAETAVAKALDGKTTSLQRYGIVLGKHATNEQVATAISARFGGQARANTTDLDRLHAVVGNVEAKLGQAFLPEIDKVAGGLERWLSNQQNVNRFVGEARRLIDEAVSAVETFAHDANAVAHALGGWKHTLELLLALKVASTLAGWAGALSSFTDSSGKALGKSDALLANMRSLARIGVVSVGVDLLFQAKGQGAKGIIGAMLTGAGVGSIFGPYGALAGGALGLTIDAFVNLYDNKGNKAFQGQQDQRQRRSDRAAALHLKAGMTAQQVGDVASAAEAAGNTAAFDALNRLYDKLVARGPDATVSKREAIAYDVRYSPVETSGPQPGRSQAGRALYTSTHSIVGAAEYYGTGGGKGIYGVTPTDAGRVLDCSAYVYEVFTRLGFRGFPANSEDQWNVMGRANWTSDVISVDEAGPGDVVFYNVPHGEGSFPNHVGIVVRGRGRSAMVMQYYTRGKGSGTYSIIQSYAIQGVKRFAKVGKSTGLGSGGGGGIFGGSIAGASTGTSNVHAVTGSNLIPIGLRGAIGHAANMATTTSGLVAARWLHTEIHDLEHARSLLEEKLKVAHGKQRAAIQTEIQRIDSAIARTQKSFAGALAGWAQTELSALEKQADARFERQTAAHIANVLGPRYYQGTDPATGQQRLTPAEAKLAAMQAADQLASLQQSLAQAQTPQEKAAAQRALDEYTLQAEATKERAKADADYAKAVAKYQADRSRLEARMNRGLSHFVNELARGTKALSDLTKVLAPYGLGKAGHGPTHVKGGTGAVAAISGGMGVDEVGGALVDRLADVLASAVVPDPRRGQVAGDVYLDKVKVGVHIARPVSDAQRRQISYTLQRG